MDLRIDYQTRAERPLGPHDRHQRGPSLPPMVPVLIPISRSGTARIDELVLHAPGTRWTPLDDQGIPTGSQPVDGH